MPMARALRLCPAAAVRRGRMARYREVSAQVFAIFGRFTARVEPLSIDEAFLDVTGCQRLFGPGDAIAARIRATVRGELGLAVSAGVAPNRFLAKLASEAAKPDGLKVVVPAEVEAFLTPLPVSALWGVGGVTEQRLRARGVHTVADLRRLDQDTLRRLLGQTGETLYRLARGQDDRPVRPSRGVKSVSHEDTFAVDLVDAGALDQVLRDQSERVARRLRKQGLRGRRVTVKVRYGDFTTVTRSRTLAAGVDNGLYLYRTARELLSQTEAGRRSVRLLGVGVAEWSGGEGQGELFAAEADQGRRRALDGAVDRLRERFGGAVLGPADLAALPSEADEGSDGDE
jgi:DNA polymerase-4